MRSFLVTALVARAESPLKSGVRRFVCGLSCDELQFIASFLGACILESAGRPDGPQFSTGEACELQPRQGYPDRGAEDRDLKMILLVEYLYRSGMRQTSISIRSKVRST